MSSVNFMQIVRCQRCNIELFDDFKRIEVPKRRKFPKKETPAKEDNISQTMESDNAFRLIIFDSFTPDKINELKEILAKYPGQDEVLLKIMEGAEGKKIKLEITVNNTKKLVSEVEKTFGDIVRVVA